MNWKKATLKGLAGIHRNVPTILTGPLKSRMTMALIELRMIQLDRCISYKNELNRGSEENPAPNLGLPTLRKS